MFRAKRKFTLKGSPLKAYTRTPVKTLSISSPKPFLQINSSPIKRLRLSSLSLTNGNGNFNGATTEEKVLPFDDGASLQSIIELTPKSEEKFEYPVTTDRSEELGKEAEELDSLIQSKFETIKTTREAIYDLQAKRYLVKDYIDIANKGHCNVRNLLNEIYNSGQELAKRAATLTEEARGWHQKKFERMELVLSEKIEAKRVEVRDQIKLVTHEIELHERTLIHKTLECQRKQIQQSQDAEQQRAHSEAQTQSQNQPIPELKQEPEQDQQEGSLNESRDKSEQVVVDDDECVIIDGDEPETLEQQNTAGNQSGTTNTCDMEDDEQTDIEESIDSDMNNTRNGEEKRPFTPCQAQRPM